MITHSLYNWQWPEVPDQTAIVAIKERFPSYSEEFIALAVQRGIQTVEQFEAEIVSPQPIFHHPNQLYQIDLAIERITQAIENQEAILIYGDYDVDGITSTLILYEGLQTLGANVFYHLPNRYTDGYGPNIKTWDRLIEQHQLNLIITCDNGVIDHGAVQKMKEHQVDVIITDHHEIQGELPPAIAVIHPKHPDGNYPFKELSGAGVALKVISALLEEVPSDALELAALGTIADMVPLIDENRTIVKMGLEAIRRTERPGLIKLIEQSPQDFEYFDEETVSFSIAPKLNALGRMDDPKEGLELLHTYDPVRIEEISQKIESINDQRKALTEQIESEVIETLESLEKIPPIIMMSGPHWLSGVLGISAGKIARLYHRPTLLFQESADKAIYKGSGRSIEGIDLFDNLTPFKSLMQHFGGHAQAVGMTLTKSNYETLKTELESHFAKYQSVIDQPDSIKVDLTVPIERINQEFIEEVNQLAPFGMDNAKPIFCIEHVQINSKRRIGQNQQHIRLTLEQAEDELNAIGFFKGESFDQFQLNEEVSAIGTLNINRWNGQTQVQLNLEDLGSDGTRWIDARSKQSETMLAKLSEAVYLFQSQSVLEQFQAKIRKDAMIALYSNIKQVMSSFTNPVPLVIMESPERLEDLATIINDLTWNAIYLGCTQDPLHYWAGPIEREEVTKVYRFMLQYPQMDYNHYLNDIAIQLSIPLIKVRQIFIMFVELQFVRIEAGQLRLNPIEQHIKTDYTKTRSYQQFEDYIQSEELLYVSTVNDIKNYFEER